MPGEKKEGPFPAKLGRFLDDAVRRQTEIGAALFSILSILMIPSQFRHALIISQIISGVKQIIRHTSLWLG